MALVNAARHARLSLTYAEPMRPPTESRPAPVGLCATCLHSRKIQSDRGSLFFLCQLSETDPTFPKYPRLPVLSCPGYAPSAPPVSSGV